MLNALVASYDMVTSYSTVQLYQCCSTTNLVFLDALVERKRMKYLIGSLFAAFLNGVVLWSGCYECPVLVMNNLSFII